MVLLWRDEMGVGQPDIDGDHRQLIAIINDFQAMALRLPEDRALHETLIGLHDYAAYHFSREESIQRACHQQFSLWVGRRGLALKAWR